MHVLYSYNEVATMTLKKISAVSQSVANTAKRVVVIIGSAIVFNESISGLKAIGCAVSGGVHAAFEHLNIMLSSY